GWDRQLADAVDGGPVAEPPALGIDIEEAASGAPPLDAERLRLDQTQPGLARRDADGAVLALGRLAFAAPLGHARTNAAPVGSVPGPARGRRGTTALPRAPPARAPAPR